MLQLSDAVDGEEVNARALRGGVAGADRRPVDPVGEDRTVEVPVGLEQARSEDLQVLRLGTRKACARHDEVRAGGAGVDALQHVTGA